MRRQVRWVVRKQEMRKQIQEPGRQEKKHIGKQEIRQVGGSVGRLWFWERVGFLFHLCLMHRAHTSMSGKQRCSLKDVFSYIFLHFHVNQCRTPYYSTRVSTMRCIQAPEEELELLGQLLAPGKLDFASRVLFLNFVTIIIQANLLENVKFTLENQKFLTLQKKVTTMVGL